MKKRGRSGWGRGFSEKGLEKGFLGSRNEGRELFSMLYKLFISYLLLFTLLIHPLLPFPPFLFFF
jgi:hypothetical protein